MAGLEPATISLERSSSDPIELHGQYAQAVGGSSPWSLAYPTILVPLPCLDKSVATQMKLLEIASPDLTTDRTLLSVVYELTITATAPV